MKLIDLIKSSNNHVSKKCLSTKVIINGIKPKKIKLKILTSMTIKKLKNIILKEIINNESNYNRKDYKNMKDGLTIKLNNVDINFYEDDEIVNTENIIMINVINKKYSRCIICYENISLKNLIISSYNSKKCCHPLHKECLRKYIDTTDKISCCLCKKIYPVSKLIELNYSIVDIFNKYKKKYDFINVKEILCNDNFTQYIDITIKITYNRNNKFFSHTYLGKIIKTTNEFHIICLNDCIDIFEGNYSNHYIMANIHTREIRFFPKDDIEKCDKEKCYKENYKKFLDRYNYLIFKKHRYNNYIYEEIFDVIKKQKI